jgi:hypothetical protein
LVLTPGEAKPTGVVNPNGPIPLGPRPRRSRVGPREFVYLLKQRFRPYTGRHESNRNRHWQSPFCFCPARAGGRFERRRVQCGYPVSPKGMNEVKILSSIRLLVQTRVPTTHQPSRRLHHRSDAQLWSSSHARTLRAAPPSAQQVHSKVSLRRAVDTVQRCGVACVRADHQGLEKRHDGQAACDSARPVPQFFPTALLAKPSSLSLSHTHTPAGTRSPPRSAAAAPAPAPPRPGPCSVRIQPKT